MINRYLVCPNTAKTFAVALYYFHYLRTSSASSSLTHENTTFYSSIEHVDLVEAYANAMEDGQSVNCKVICLNSAHPGKFPYFVAEALNAPAGNIMPKDIQE